MEYMARLPPIMKEFQEVTTPHRPPTMSTLAMTEVLNATAIASAVTKPLPDSYDASMAPESSTRPTEKMMST